MIEFDWLIHYRCNYRCAYCFFEGMWEEVDKKNLQVPVEKWVEAFKRLQAKHEEMKITITGGEPTAFPGFIELISALQKFAFISFDTNLSFNEEFLVKFLKAADPKRMFLGASFHPEFAVENEFKRKLERLKKAGFDFRIHYVTYPPHIGAMEKFRKEFMGLGFRFTPIPFRGNYSGMKYPEAFTEAERLAIYGVADKIEPKDSEWVASQVVQVKSKGRKCQAGLKYARIDCDGTVYLCGNDFTKSDMKYKLGNMLNADFAMNIEAVVCRQETCPCEFRWIIE